MPDKQNRIPAIPIYRDYLDDVFMKTSNIGKLFGKKIEGTQFLTAPLYAGGRLSMKALCSPEADPHKYTDYSLSEDIRITKIYLAASSGYVHEVGVESLLEFVFEELKPLPGFPQSKTMVLRKFIRMCLPAQSFGFDQNDKALVDFSFGINCEFDLASTDFSLCFDEITINQVNQEFIDSRQDAFWKRRLAETTVDAVVVSAFLQPTKETM